MTGVTATDVGVTQDVAGVTATDVGVTQDVTGVTAKSLESLKTWLE